MSLLDELTLLQSSPDKERVRSYGRREDGTPKGAGFFGEIRHPRYPDEFSTERSVGVRFDGREQMIPLIVPTLTRQELLQVIEQQDDDAIVRKAIAHARQRQRQGLPPFAQPGEPIHPLP